MDGQQEIIELTTEAEDSESEKEDNKDEKDKKLQIDLSRLYCISSNILSNNLELSSIETVHHPEITTPPPEYC